MPLVRRLLKVGTSRAIAIPPDWLREHEAKTGRPIEELLMELNGEITLRVREKRRKKKVV